MPLLQATINEAASRVCRNLGLLRGACKKIMRTCLRLISRDILAGKKPQEVCVDIKLCKHKAGEYRGDSKDSFWRASDSLPKNVQHGLKTQTCFFFAPPTCSASWHCRAHPWPWVYQIYPSPLGWQWKIFQNGMFKDSKLRSPPDLSWRTS